MTHQGSRSSLDRQRELVARDEQSGYSGKHWSSSPKQCSAEREGANSMVRLILVFAIAVSTAACSVSKSTNYYVLTANSDTPAVQVSTVFEDQPSLGVGPVSVPEYLQRSQIVYSMMGNQLTVSSANQW